MTVWRYRAVPLDPALPRNLSHGEMAAQSAEEVNCALRRAGLQAIGLERPSRSFSQWIGGLHDGHVFFDLVAPSLYAHLRTRRTQTVSEIYDGLATMLQSGVPLAEAAQTLSDSARTRARRSARSSMLGRMTDGIKSGQSFADVLAEWQGWFDPIDIALIRAGQEAGDLPATLRRLSDRGARRDALTQRLATVLIYPVLVALVGCAVVVFLSTRTLPDLVAILDQSQIDTPPLTSAMISFGGFLSRSWWWLGLGALAALFGLPMMSRAVAGVSRRQGSRIDAICRALTPRLVRRLAVADLAEQLCELTRAGIPFVQALRIIAPTVRRFRLRQTIQTIIERVERGDELTDAFDEPEWFEAEFRRLLVVGQSTGEIDELLERIASRYRRQSERLIERLSALLEPCVILILAGVIGTVVMAAILPLVRLQEIIR